MAQPTTLKSSKRNPPLKIPIVAYTFGILFYLLLTETPGSCLGEKVKLSGCFPAHLATGSRSKNMLRSNSFLSSVAVVRRMQSFFISILRWSSEFFDQ